MLVDDVVLVDDVSSEDDSSLEANDPFTKQHSDCVKFNTVKLTKANVPNAKRNFFIFLLFIMLLISRSLYLLAFHFRNIIGYTIFSVLLNVSESFQSIVRENERTTSIATIKDMIPKDIFLFLIISFIIDT